MLGRWWVHSIIHWGGGGVQVTILVLTHFSGRLPSLIVGKSLVEVLLPRIAGRTELCYWVKLPHIFTVSHCAPHFVTGLLGGLVHFIAGGSRLGNP